MSMIIPSAGMSTKEEMRRRLQPELSRESVPGMKARFGPVSAESALLNACCACENQQDSWRKKTIIVFVSGLYLRSGGRDSAAA